jgi:hypothetical protein
MTRIPFWLLLGIIAAPLLSSFDDFDVIPLHNIKSITEWREYADKSIAKDTNKWLTCKRDYYPNGVIQQLLYAESNKDTFSLYRFILNNDSSIKNELIYKFSNNG